MSQQSNGCSGDNHSVGRSPPRRRCPAPGGQDEVPSRGPSPDSSRPQPLLNRDQAATRQYNGARFPGSLGGGRQEEHVAPGHPERSGLSPRELQSGGSADDQSIPGGRTCLSQDRSYPLEPRSGTKGTVLHEQPQPWVQAEPRAGLRPGWTGTGWSVRFQWVNVTPTVIRTTTKS